MQATALALCAPVLLAVSRIHAAALAVSETLRAALHPKKSVTRGPTTLETETAARRQRRPAGPTAPHRGHEGAGALQTAARKGGSHETSKCRASLHRSRFTFLRSGSIGRKVMVQLAHYCTELASGAHPASGMGDLYRPNDVQTPFILTLYPGNVFLAALQRACGQ